MKKYFKALARSLRRNQTETEKLLWRKLRSRQFQNLKFRRQQSLGSYVVDFCSFEAKLIIELDGGQHLGREKEDEERTQFLSRGGFKVIRFWNHDVLKTVDTVLEEVSRSIIESPSPRPSPLEGEGGEK